MLEMIGKMSAITLLHILLTFLLWWQLKDCKMTPGLRICIGVIYGLTAVLSTHFGIDYGDMVLNVRDLGPMCAGLFFDPLSGIIAGIIGGVERYIAGTYFGIGSFTRIACSISTIFAGFFAAFMYVFIFNRKKPSAPYAFFMGAVIEVFHMYVVFITHRDDMEMAFRVVKTCCIPMILFSAIGLAVSAELIRIASGEGGRLRLSIPSEERSVSSRFQEWLFAVTFIVLLTSFIFNFNLQTETATQNARQDLRVAAADINAEYTRLMKYKVDLSRMHSHVGSNGAYAIIDRDDNVIAGSRLDAGLGDDVVRLFKEHGKNEFYTREHDGVRWLCYNTTLDDGRGLVAMLPYPEVYLYRNMQAYETMLADILIFTVIYVLITLLVQSIVIDNLKLVNESLAKITDGDFDEQVSVYESSEFASLSDDINAMVFALKGYIAAAEKRMEQELLLAHTIQESSLPTNFEFQHGGFEIFAAMDPAKEVGGDFYDFFFVEQDQLAIVIADVSGKGIPAALFMMHSKTAIRSLAETGTEITEVFSKVNNELCEGNQAEMFVTVWMAIMDLKQGVATCVNAGHEYPALMRKDGNYELLKDKHGIPLGCMEDMAYRSYEISLEPGDCLFVYTDGIPEAINPAEEQYGTDRMIDVLNENKDKEMKAILPAVKESVDEFAGTADQFDDQTMIGFRYLGPEDMDEKQGGTRPERTEK